MTLVCQVCRGYLEPGEALLVTPRQGTPFAIHRPSVQVRCVQRLGLAAEFPIALLDRQAARDFDRRQGSAPIADPGTRDPRGRAPWRASPA